MSMMESKSITASVLTVVAGDASASMEDML
jgi:hypothetical protein